VKGETLTIVGGGLFPDVYSRPFHSLNFNLNYDFGVEDKFALNFGVNNILNSQREQFYGAFQAQDQIFSRFSPDTSISLGLKYSIF